jgi:hypothetical protein
MLIINEAHYNQYHSRDELCNFKFHDQLSN